MFKLHLKLHLHHLQLCKLPSTFNYIFMFRDMQAIETDVTATVLNFVWEGEKKKHRARVHCSEVKGSCLQKSK